MLARPARRRTMAPPLRMVQDTASSLSSSRSLSRPVCLGPDSEFGFLVQPNVFKAPAIEDAVDHHPQALDPGLPAGGEPQVIDDRPRLVLLQSPVDLPHQPLALLVVGLH